jgi:hypothetical protein
MQLTLRNATLDTLVSELREQQERKVDLIVPARDLWTHNGTVIVRDAGKPVVSETGVTTTNLELAASTVFDDGMCGKLTLPRAYVRQLRDSGRTDILDTMFNRTLHGNTDLGVTGDDRRFLLRTFTGTPGGSGLGLARALLSDSYKTIDHWDVLMAALNGMKAAGLDAHVVRDADLTDRRMYVKIVAPEIAALAPELLKNYQSPFSGNRGADNPTVYAGFVLSNSETGGGAFTITPRLEVQVCTNGMTITADAVRKTHLGAKLEDDGVVKYSAGTLRKNLDLITAQTTDAVRTFLDTDYMNKVIRRLTAKAGQPVGKPQDVVTQVVRREAFSKADADGILEHFIKGADMTNGGIFQAITSYAQTVDNADTAYAMEMDAMAAAGLTGVTGK